LFLHKPAFCKTRLCFLSSVLLSAYLPLGLTAADLGSNKIAARLVEETSSGGPTEAFVVLAEQADLTAARSMRTKLDKGIYVYRTLRAVAERTQASMRAMLEARGIPYQSFYIVNAIKVTADRKLLEELAARGDVARLEANPQVRTALPSPTGVDMPRLTSSQNLAMPTVEWNIKRVNAPSVWAMGYKGQGLVVASLDTGVKWDHPALKSHYRGWNGLSAHHNYNWLDTTRQHLTTPTDPNSHGTFTTSEMVGDDGHGNQVGVAPGAKWIACRSMDQNGTGSPAQYIECFEFFLAPYPIGHPERANPAMAPDAINNSWDCPSSEGCSLETLVATVNAVRAAGIFPVMAAGNSGPDCSTVSVPPAFYASAVTVGATDMYTNQITIFSSRGPVTADRSRRMKPELTAPGDYIRGAVPYNNEYQGYWEGTSMAAPEVTGGVALLWQANPLLQGDVDLTVRILEQSATPFTTTQKCGGSGLNVPNNVYGYGMLNLLPAVKQAKKLK